MSKLAVGDRVRVLINGADEAPVTAGDEGYVTEVNPLGDESEIDEYSVQMVTDGESWFFTESNVELVPVQEAEGNSTGPHIHVGYERVVRLAAEHRVRIETTWPDGTRVEVTPDGYTYG